MTDSSGKNALVVQRQDKIEQIDKPCQSKTVVRMVGRATWVSVDEVAVKAAIKEKYGTRTCTGL